MNILVTGSNGQLGRALRLKASASKHNFVFTDISQCQDFETVIMDITDFSSVNSIVEKERIDAIINCAAYTNVEAAESDEYTAGLINAEGPEVIAKAIKNANGILIHISTDYVFGGELYNAPVSEECKCSPLGIYGLTKLRGEQSIISTGCKHVILRTAWLYSESGKNFCKTILNLIESKSNLNVVYDQIGTPTYASDLAEAILNILDNYSDEKHLENYSKSGIYHYTNEGVCSWYDFAKMISQYAENESCAINSCRSHEFPSKVARPAYSVLDKSKIKETFGIQIPYWTDSLKKCIKNLKSI